MGLFRTPPFFPRPPRRWVPTLSPTTTVENSITLLVESIVPVSQTKTVRVETAMGGERPSELLFESTSPLGEVATSWPLRVESLTLPESNRLLRVESRADVPKSWTIRGEWLQGAVAGSKVTRFESVMGGELRVTMPIESTGFVTNSRVIRVESKSLVSQATLLRLGTLHSLSASRVLLIEWIAEENVVAASKEIYFESLGSVASQWALAFEGIQGVAGSLILLLESTAAPSAQRLLRTESLGPIGAARVLEVESLSPSAGSKALRNEALQPIAGSEVLLVESGAEAGLIVAPKVLYVESLTAAAATKILYTEFRAGSDVMLDIEHVHPARARITFHKARSHG